MARLNIIFKDGSVTYGSYYGEDLRERLSVLVHNEELKKQIAHYWLSNDEPAGI